MSLALHEVLRRRPFMWGQAAAEVGLANAQAAIEKQPPRENWYKARPNQRGGRGRNGGQPFDDPWRDDKAKGKGNKDGKDPKGKGKNSKGKDGKDPKGKGKNGKGDKGGKDPKGKGKKNGKQSKDDGYIRHPKGTW